MKLAAHLQQSTLLYLKNGNENLSVTENEHYRWLLFDDVIQSIMLKRMPNRLTLPHQHFLALPLLFISPTNIIELGLGGGNLIRFLQEKLPQACIESVEYNQQVIECFEEYFNPQSIPHKIINSSFEFWLTKQKKISADWLLYDIYQTGVEADVFLKQITKVMKKMSKTTWLSINLPDLDEHQLNVALLHLSSIKKNRVMRYFHVPRYKNIVIHLSPEQIGLETDNSILPHYLISRWSTLWMHGMVTR